MRCIYTESDAKGNTPYKVNAPAIQLKVYTPDSAGEYDLPYLIGIREGYVNQSGNFNFNDFTWNIISDQFMEDAKLIREAQSIYDELKERVFKGGD